MVMGHLVGECELLSPLFPLFPGPSQRSAAMERGDYPFNHLI